jgi:hypothetical protein
MYNITVYNNSNLNNDLNASDETALDSFFMNWTAPFNLTKGSGILMNTSPFESARNYLINVSANDTSNNVNWTYVNVSVLEYTPVVDTAPPIWSDPRNFTQQANSSFSVPFNATDDVAIDQYWLNATTHFNVSYTGILYNVTNLSTIGFYMYNISVNDTSNNLNWTTVTINITEQVITPPVITGLTADDMYILYNYERSDLTGEEMVFSYAWEY